MIISEWIKGLMDYRNAHQVIMRHSLWPWIFIPGVLSLLYLSSLIVLGAVYLPDLANALYDSYTPEFLKWEPIAIIAKILIWIPFLLVAYLTYKHVVLIIFSPLLSYLSELVEKHVYGGPGPSFQVSQLLKDLVRGILINLRNLFLTLVFVLLAWSLILIPVIGGIISMILILLIQFYFDGFGLVDYTLERKQYSVSQSILFVKQNRFRIMGVGAGFLMFMLIPVAGWLLAPAYGTVAATLAACEKINENPVSHPF